MKQQLKFNQINYQKNIMRVFQPVRYSVSYRKQGLVKAPQPIIYKVISSTQDYPSFIPFIESSKILKTNSPFQNYTQLTISYSKFRSLSYTSLVKMQPRSASANGKSLVYSLCEEEPLKKLQSVWQIEARGEASFIRYNLNFQFLSPLYTLASSVMKDYMGEQLWNLFQKQSLFQKSKLQNQSHKVKFQEHTHSPARSSPTGEKKTGRLLEFLEKNPEIKVIYETNLAGKQKIEQIHKRLEEVSDYDSKMLYEIKNMILHL